MKAKSMEFEDTATTMELSSLKSAIEAIKTDVVRIGAEIEPRASFNTMPFDIRVLLWDAAIQDSTRVVKAITVSTTSYRVTVKIPRYWEVEMATLFFGPELKKDAGFLSQFLQKNHRKVDGAAHTVFFDVNGVPDDIRTDRRVKNLAVYAIQRQPAHYSEINFVNFNKLTRALNCFDLENLCLVLQTHKVDHLIAPNQILRFTNGLYGGVGTSKDIDPVKAARIVNMFIDASALKTMLHAEFPKISIKIVQWDL